MKDMKQCGQGKNSPEWTRSEEEKLGKDRAVVVKYGHTGIHSFIVMLIWTH